MCIGIDAYPAKYRLAGCVADAETWKAAFEEAGFEVDLLTNRKATRERMVEMIKDLVVSSRAGDVLALQYSGHGTTVEDFDHDEKPEFEGDTALVDEAICPVDFSSGNLLIDDDLGEIWDLLPDGVSLTMFFDSCHSGGNQRDLTLDVPTANDARARLVRLTPRTVAAYRKKRGTRRIRSTGDRERGVFFAACRPDDSPGRATATATSPGSRPRCCVRRWPGPATSSSSSRCSQGSVTSGGRRRCWCRPISSTSVCSLLHRRSAHCPTRSRPASREP